MSDSTQSSDLFGHCEGGKSGLQGGVFCDPGRRAQIPDKVVVFEKGVAQLKLTLPLRKKIATQTNKGKNR